jgi:hypothetical protein
MPSPTGITRPRRARVDATGQVFVPWSQRRGVFPRSGERAFTSTHSITWRTTGLWGWTWHADFVAAAVSRNGRAVAIRTVTNLPQATRTTVAMRVFHPA